MTNPGWLREALEATLGRQGGVIFAEPALVGRAMYTGRDILGQNSRFGPCYEDERGYIPVEYWIMSMTPAGNEQPKQDEGVTRVLLADGTRVLLTDAAQAARTLLFGEYADRWPLTKVLDIGGAPVVPSYGPTLDYRVEPEVPPIPVHVHAGKCVDGRIKPPGKLEAYFFPPVDVPPYSRRLGNVFTRLGLEPGTTQAQVLAALREFGASDVMYALSRRYEIRPYDGWVVHPGCIHAPGPWPTFEIQLPQDDFNFAAWHLGERLDPAERERLRQIMMLRGLKDEDDFLQQVVNWDLSTDAEFEHKYRRPAQLIEMGPWGRRLQIFFEEFYGEALEIEPGYRYTPPIAEEPWAGIVWSGDGNLNGHRVGAFVSQRASEFLATPGSKVTLENDGPSMLQSYTIFPRGTAIRRRTVAG